MSIIKLTDASATNRTLTGGKGASLARLLQAGFNVPTGFVLTDNDFKQTEIFSMLEYNKRYAVRSSAIAEDGEQTSFAGMFESKLNISKDNIIEAINAVFESANSQRVKEYAKTQGISDVGSIAAVIQEMVDSEISGVMFTADPITSDRFTTVIESVKGLGESLVSGQKNPEELLTKPQKEELENIGKKIEKLFGCPQDIEWCFKDGVFYIVQSRPITTLYPLPESKDGFKRCYISAGHFQMMTDAILPLGMSFMEMLAFFENVRVGGRGYIEVTHDFASVVGRKTLLSRTSSVDPLMNDIIKQILNRSEYIKSVPKGKGSFNALGVMKIPSMLGSFLRLYRRNNPADISAYVERKFVEFAKLSEKFNTLSGAELICAVQDDQKNLATSLFDPEGYGLVMVGMYTASSIDKICKKLTGEEHVTNYISKSVEHNITSQMGIALADVADVIRPYSQVVLYLETCAHYDKDKLLSLEGGKKATLALEDFLLNYGMRATGEIDVTRTRFSENPTELFPALLSNIKTLEFGHGKAMFLQGKIEAEHKIEELLSLCKAKYGNAKAKKLAHKIDVFRNFVGAREYPKYFWICRYDIYKKALMRLAEQLVEQGILNSKEDIYYLYLDEVKNTVETNTADNSLIKQRKADYKFFKTLTPPRVIFSDGEVPKAEYCADIPENALAGLAVSGGVVMGRARVIYSVEQAIIEKGDILVTRFTDPSWTPVFISVAGLVTEIGGMMTHGSVITREYGLPAVVGVVGATTLIKDGDIILLNGDKGYIEIIKRGE